MFIRKSEYELLLQQAAYWKEQYERERSRADRLTNNLLQTNGLPPATALEEVLESDHPISRKRKRFEEHMAELFNDEVEDGKIVDAEIEE